MKIIRCSKCGTQDRSHLGMCAKCYRAYYYQKHRKELINYTKDWISKNQEKNRATRRKISKRRWSRLTPEQKTQKSREQEKRRTQEQIEKRHAYANLYYERNKGTQRHKDTNRRAKEKRRAKENSVLCDFSKKQWGEIKDLYDHCCAYCGKKFEKLTQDHVTPISKGGNHTADNIVPACMKCNRKKWAGPPPPGFVPKVINVK